MNPPPKPPLRELQVDFDLGSDDPETAKKNARVILYQKLVACVDALSLQEATDLVEIACIFADVTQDEKAALLRVVRAVPRPLEPAQ